MLDTPPAKQKLPKGDRIPYMFVVNFAGVIEQRQVELGIRSITRQQIISSVKANKSVVTQGQLIGAITNIAI